MTLHVHTLQELQYSIGMSINTLVTAMGMQAQNDYLKSKGEAPKYTFEDFEKLILQNGTHHNGLCGISQGMV